MPANWCSAQAYFGRDRGGRGGGFCPAREGFFYLFSCARTPVVERARKRVSPLFPPASAPNPLPGRDAIFLRAASVFWQKIRGQTTKLESVFHGASWRRDPCCLYSIEPAEAAASIHATASAPTPLLGEVGLRAAQAVTRERPASCDAREAARAGRGAGGGGKHASSRALPPKRPILSKLCPFIINYPQHYVQVACVLSPKAGKSGIPGVFSRK